MDTISGDAAGWTPTPERDGTALYRAIVRCLEEDLARGRLAPGARLPTHRDLADALGVTVGTVTRAYAEARRRGLVEATVGRGTFVRAPRRESFPRAAAPPPRAIDLTLNTPLEHLAPDLPRALRALAKQPDTAELLHYAAPGGSPRHREAGAAWVREHGLDVDASRVLVCAGVQHALFVALSGGAVPVAPGDTVLTESLTYPGFRAAAEALHLEVRGVAVDREGIVPESVAEVAARTGARLLYTTPTLHNPTGSVLPEARRRALAGLARRTGLHVVEDDVHRLLAPDAPPPIAAFAPEHTTHLAGVSKGLAGGLRVAFLTAPPGAAPRLARAVWATSWMAPPLVVEIATRWIRDGTLTRTAAAKRREARRRQALARRILGADDDAAHPDAYHRWLALPEPWTAEAFAREAAGRGVLVTPSSAFHVGPGPAPAAVRLSLSAPHTRGELERGLRTLAALLGRAPDPARPAVL